MFVGGMALVREPYGKSLVLGAMVLICCVGALALGRLVWPAALGSLLVLAYWALEMLVWRLAQSRPGLPWASPWPAPRSASPLWPASSSLSASPRATSS